MSRKTSWLEDLGTLEFLIYGMNKIFVLGLHEKVQFRVKKGVYFVVAKCGFC